MAQSEPTEIPAQGRGAQELLDEVSTGRAGDLDWKGGRAFSLVYNADDPVLEDLQHGVANVFLHDNALNPFAYPSLMKMEADLVSMVAGLLGTGPQSGALTSGGSESIFCAMQTAREHARSEHGIAEPVVLLPSTAHPAFTKAAHNLDIEAIRIPVDSSGMADVAATKAAVDDRTAMIVGSAPCYPYGVIDPIEDLADLAASRDVLCHVDSCLGGLLLPFWAELGEPVPAWDFRVEGVTSMSADLHKYGYAYKGASVVLYRDRSLLKHQFFGFDDWPGGFYGSATPAGTRPAPPIAGAWATLMHLGFDGLLAKAEIVRDTTAALHQGIESIGDFQILHNPAMSVLLFASASKDSGSLGAAMAERGWGLDVVQEGLHLMVSPGHSHIVEPFLADLKAVFGNVSADAQTSESPTYGSRAV